MSSQKSSNLAPSTLHRILWLFFHWFIKFCAPYFVSYEFLSPFLCVCVCMCVNVCFVFSFFFACSIKFHKFITTWALGLSLNFSSSCFINWFMNNILYILWGCIFIVFFFLVPFFWLEKKIHIFNGNEFSREFNKLFDEILCLKSFPFWHYKIHISSISWNSLEISN